PPRAFAVGMLWGWLPCGLVYSTLALALMSGGPADGAIVMLAFGLGTLPNLVAAGLAIERLQPWLRRQGVRRAAAALVFSLGVWGLVRTPGLYGTGRERVLRLIYRARRAARGDNKNGAAMYKPLLAVDGSDPSVRATQALIQSLREHKASPQIDVLTVHLPLPNIGTIGSVITKEIRDRYYQ